MNRINPYKLFVGAFVPNWLLCRSEISPSAKLLYGRLCQFAGQDGRAFPSGETIAAEISVSLPTVRRLVAELKKAGLIETSVEHYGGTASYYFLDHEWIGIKNETSEQDQESQKQNHRSLKIETPGVSKTRLINRISKRISEESLFADSAGKMFAGVSDRKYSPYGEVVDFWFRRYQERTGERYLFTEKDGSLIKRLLKAAGSASKLIACIDLLFSQKDEWLEKKGGYSVAMLSARYNSLLSIAAKSIAEKEARERAERENVEKLDRMDRV